MLNKPKAFYILIVFALIAGYSVSRAQLLASFSLQGTAGLNQIVSLSWGSPADTSISYTYYVFRGTGDFYTDSSITYTLIDSTTATSTTDTNKVSVETSFVYVVKTKNKNGETIRSNFVMIKLFPVKDVVVITSQAPTRARVGSPYAYQVTATSSDTTAVLTYRLPLKPALMTIDTATGLLQWSPVARGWYPVVLAVRSSKGGKAFQEFSISVAAGNGTVEGTVVDSVTHAPLKRVIVKLFEERKDFHLSYQTVTNDSGKYTIRFVDPGNYFIHAMPLNPHFRQQWYYEARDRDDATTVAVQDSPSITTVNFSLLRDTLSVPIFAAKGNVSDTLGKGIRGALVVWVKAGFAFNGARFDRDDTTHAEDEREVLDPNNPLPSYDLSLDGRSDFVFRALTDSSGNYSIRLPQGFYVVRAWKRGFHRIFYNNHSSLLEAEIFHLNQDTTQINFVLRPNPPFAGEIGGTVIDSTSGKGVSARMIAYREWWSAQDTVFYFRRFVTDADSSGNYLFDDLPPGQYRILAVPLGYYAPSFYSTSGPTIRWGLATTVMVHGTNVSGIDIDVVPFPRSGEGFTSVSGSITTGTQPQGGTLNKTASSYLLPGAMVYAMDSTGTVAGYGITDQTGSYTINGIAPGTYSITVDNTEYSSATTSNVSPTYDVNGNPVPGTANMSVSSTVLTGVVQARSPLPTTYSLEQNYPNPFNPSTEISFSLPMDNKISLMIYNILGQRVVTLAQGVYRAGNHIVTWNGKDDRGIPAASGVYFYRLSGPGFAIAKKMILLK